MHSYEPRQGHRLAHDPLNAIVAPRPIGWVSTTGADGTPNLAPYSFFNLFNYRPPIVGFSSIGRKDSVTNAEASGEFVWNLASVALAERMNATSAAVGPEVDEFALAGLSAQPSTLVGPPRVGESLVAFECRVTGVQELTDTAGRGVDAWLVLGEVVLVHLDDSVLVDGVFDTLAADPLLRAGGPSDYFTLAPERRLRMDRPG
ncbi:flavin reductase family protein [Kineococcus rhizosphaerae]|uniref:Flavin reductase (DIM6/NTAB) family NADH-FMN oxidoreductase RutF n=1 Tax=Kineococcus rhizosphaerae TaxID=559628 RepID=A0A2T0R285_9ACTN|nr:flavin reductase family protein [Kineococcus rhizosphaerae]PRY13890.1 flavin reductase (DIM6/NTAB) family NADH-FMN oxidoreductase RutF [Kineococcus rhizosphaerae]